MTATTHAAAEAPRRDKLAALLQRCAAGDKVAFRELYDLQAARLTGIAMRITGDAGTARDAVHDTFLLVWQQAWRFDPARGVGEAWLVGIARRRAIALTRRRARESLGHEPPDEPDDAPDALERLMASRRGQALHACLGQLEQSRQRLVALAYVEGLSHAQLSERLGMPLGTVKSSLRRSLETLRRCLDR